tara:strand:- start:3965 stop:4111 length:147 start_codon:yes stop_codon:yes gene_type:complete
MYWQASLQFNVNIFDEVLYFWKKIITLEQVRRYIINGPELVVCEMGET